jgi:hypothetical protein
MHEQIVLKSSPNIGEKPIVKVCQQLHWVSVVTTGGNQESEVIEFLVAFGFRVLGLLPIHGNSMTSRGKQNVCCASEKALQVYRSRVLHIWNLHFQSHMQKLMLISTTANLER